MSDMDRENAVFEKRKWVGLTHGCNNNCVFCLDGSKKIGSKTKNQIIKELDDGLKEGCERLVISGGEPTTHPDFLDIIRIGKGMGYKKVQVITNGRMFYYKGFLRRAMENGLDEITFSIHGHTPELHDSLTTVKGSFGQTITGLENALKSGLIVSVDIVLNKANIDSFEEISDFLIKMGVKEFDILHIMPFGNAWKNRDRLLYNPIEERQHLIRGIRNMLENGCVVWSNRMPPQVLEGFENLIQDPYKILDEVRGRKHQFERYFREGVKLDCYGERCKFCYLDEFCKKLDDMISDIKSRKPFDSIIVDAKNAKLNLTRNLNFDKMVLVADKTDNKAIEVLKNTDKYKTEVLLYSIPEKEKLMSVTKHSDKVVLFVDSIEPLERVKQLKEFRNIVVFKILITKNNYKKINSEIEFLLKEGFTVRISIIPPAIDYRNYERIVPHIPDVTEKLKAIPYKLEIENVPLCMMPLNLKAPAKEKRLNLEVLNNRMEVEIEKFALDYISNKKIKSINCEKCRHNKTCEGIFQKYVMRYGFNELKPVTD